MKATDPKTPEEWQEAVNAAYYSLCLDSAIQYGLIKMVPTDGNGKQTAGRPYKGSGVNVDRCQQIIEQGAKLGIHPQEL